MIYVNGEWLSAMEALDQLGSLSKNSHKEFIVRCDSRISDKCRKEYQIEYRRYLKVLDQNDGNIRCIYCSRTVKFTGRNNPNTKYIFDDNYFSNIDTSEKAYLLGWIASDGSIGIGKFCVAIHEKDIEILDLFQKYICKDVPIRKFTTPTSKLCSYTICSKQISNDLCRHLKIKPRKKSSTVKFPNILDVFKWDFIRGYFEGDGSINNPSKAKRLYPKGSIASNSKYMLKSINKICGIGCISNNALHMAGKPLMSFLDGIYKNSKDLKLNRKYNNYISWINYQKYLESQSDNVDKYLISRFKEDNNKETKEVYAGNTYYWKKYRKNNLDRFITARNIIKNRSVGLSLLSKQLDVSYTTAIEIDKGRHWSCRYK